MGFNTISIIIIIILVITIVIIIIIIIIIILLIMGLRQGRFVSGDKHTISSAAKGRTQIDKGTRLEA